MKKFIVINKSLLEYPYKKRDIKRFLQKRITKNVESIEGAYKEKYDTIIINGKYVKEYLRTLIRLLEEIIVLLEKGEYNYEINILLKYLQNFKVLYRIKDNFIIDDWKGDMPTFSDFLKLEINKRTGLPSYGEIQTMIDYVKSAKDVDKGDINKFFGDWIKNPEKLSIYDYVNLVSLSNKRSLSELDHKKLEDIKEFDIKIMSDMFLEIDKKKKKKIPIKINSFSYNGGSGIEFIKIGMVSDKLYPKERGVLDKFLNKKKPVVLDDGRKIMIDLEINSLFKNLVINDPNLIRDQIDEIMFREYGIMDVEYPDESLGTLSIGIKTPYNGLDKDFFPELEYILDDDYGIVVREQMINAPNIKYVVVEAKNE